MRRPSKAERMIRALAVALAVGLAGGGCVFDTSGLDYFGADFEGCWEGPSWGRTNLGLTHTSPDLLRGHLRLGPDTMAVAGRARKNNVEALLHSHGGSVSVEVLALLAADGTLTIWVAGEASAPMSRAQPTRCFFP